MKTENRGSATTGGIGFIGLLTILFIGLKLTGFIDWSWFWVLSPIIFMFLFWVVFFVVIFGLMITVKK